MVSIKRKATVDERPSKKVKSAESKESTKQDKVTKRSKIQQSTIEDANGFRPSPRSVLQQEERAFPRGGGSVLTPIEHKQLKAEAERDVLLEEEGGHLDAADGDSHDLFDVKKITANGKKKRKSERQGGSGKKKSEPASFRIQSLSYKTLLPGSTVLGRVAAITSKDIALALANNLTGFVPITAISGKINSRIETMLADVDKDGDDDEDDDDIDLKELFYVGQWVCAVVTASGNDSVSSGSKSKRHIELSLDPTQVNGVADADSVVTNSMIQSSVRSVEDHGVVMDLGLPDTTVKGFISKKDLIGVYNISQVQEGQVMLCLVTGKGSNGKVLKLNPNPNIFSIAGTGNKLPPVSDAPTVDAFQPGTAVDVLVTESSSRGVVGKVMGVLDVSADALHSGAFDELSDTSTKFKVGTKIKARIIWTLPKDDESRWIGVSLLDHLLTLTPPVSKLSVSSPIKVKSQALELDQRLPLSATIEDAKVSHVSTDRGLFLALPNHASKAEEPIRAFAHISQLSDERIDSISTDSGLYKKDSTHKARILSYNAVDNLYYVSLKLSTIEQPFLRLEDLRVGEVVKGTVHELKLGGKKGIMGVIVKLGDNISGLIPEMHLSDAQLQHPERKFREGLPVRARILSIDLDKRQLRLTAKKSFVDADGGASIWKDYHELEPGMEGKGTVINITPSGSVVQFYGSIRGFLPVSEYSESFIDVPEEHFRLGQTVNVRIATVDPETQQMKVTCRDDSTFSPEQQIAWDKISPGDLVDGTVLETMADIVKVELESGIQGSIRIGHLVDGSAAKAESAIRRMRLGQKVSRLLVLAKAQRSQSLVLSNKPDLTEDAVAGKVIKDFADVKDGSKVRGFVRNIVPEGVYVEFANNVVGLMPKSQILPEMLTLPAFGLRKDQTIKSRVVFVDADRQRFSLTLRDRDGDDAAKAQATESALHEKARNAIDPSIRSTADFTLGRVTKARISSIKSTQLQVRLADDVQGRIDVSEAFDSWDDISNKRSPLQQFKQNDVIDVKILGIYDARSHRFLPISHRQGKHPVFELSAKRSRIEEDDPSLLTLGSVQQDATYPAFINNHSNNVVWVHLSPNVRAPMSVMDLSTDVGVLQQPNRNFPVGSVIKISVKAVDPENGRLELTAKDGNTTPLTLSTISPGMILPAKVTKVTEHSVNVQLSDDLIGFIPLTEISDDYDKIDLDRYDKNDIVRVCVTDVDLPNKKIFLSLRPSRVLSSSLPIKDPQVTDASSLKEGSVVRGFVKRVAEKGVFVSLAANVDAMVRIADLSDQYVKDWKTIVEVDQLVTGRILSVDGTSKFIQMSLKNSQVATNYVPPLKIDSLEVGAFVTGKVRKVEDFGAFIDIDNTQPKLSGLCHKSEMATKPVQDPRKIYSPGDVVKAKLLKIDVASKKISLGLKASYFSDADRVEGASDDDILDDEVNDTGLFDEKDEDIEMDGGVDVSGIEDVDAQLADDGADDDTGMDTADSYKPEGLKTSGFDWIGKSLDPEMNGAISESEAEVSSGKKRKRAKAEIKVDMTGDLDKYGPRSISDFERQLLGQPNNSGLWVQYMAFQLELSEIQKARDIAERALRTIHIRETEEKATIYIAWLNLEVAYGDDARVEEVFKEAREKQDSLEMHQKLASIYIDSSKLDKADDVFRRVIANKNFRASPDVWLNYATFLMDSMNTPDRARELLKQSFGSIPNNEHRALTSRFAAMEFRSPHGDAERGRTMFEGLMSTWPKWTSGWDTWVDLERSRISRGETEDVKDESKAKARTLFERMAAQKMKKRRAHYVFKRWLEFEESEGTAKQAERVKALAAEYVQKLQSGGEDERDEE